MGVVCWKEVKVEGCNSNLLCHTLEIFFLTDPRTYCEYNRIRGRVLKAADIVRSKVTSLEECKSLCLTANFSCNYYHYGQLSDDECSLSHHTAITVSHISEPYVFSADFVSFELRACFAGKSYASFFKYFLIS